MFIIYLGEHVLEITLKDGTALGMLEEGDVVLLTEMPVVEKIHLSDGQWIEVRRKNDEEYQIVNSSMLGGYGNSLGIASIPEGAINLDDMEETQWLQTIASTWIEVDGITIDCNRMTISKKGGLTLTETKKAVKDVDFTGYCDKDL